VFSWLSNFHYDLKSFQVRRLQDYEKDTSHNLRLQLLLGLQSMKPSKNWECSLFADFLEERLLNDDLHYFLHVRNLLFDGPQLQDIQAVQEPIYFVTQKKVDWLIDILFSSATSADIREVKGKFAQIAEEKAKEVQLVDPT